MALIPYHIGHYSEWGLGSLGYSCSLFYFGVSGDEESLCVKAPDIHIITTRQVNPF